MQLQINAKANPMMLTLSAEKKNKKEWFNYMIVAAMVVAKVVTDQITANNSNF